MKKITLFLIMLCVCCGSFAQKQRKSKANGTQVVAQVNEAYKTVTDIPYTASDDAYAKERCKLDVYFPTDKKGCKVVVWYHGGGIEPSTSSLNT